MGDRPWQQPHEQASYPHTGMIEASSSIHGSIIKDPGGYDMAEFDQALFLYINSQQDQTSDIHQEQPQTLNIFPSQPMHVVEPAPKHVSMGTNNTTSNSSAGPSTRPPPSYPSSRPTPARPLASGKNGQPAAVVKREAGSSSGAKDGTTPSTSDQQEGPRTPDAKTLRRLAQNREAARKSRLRKKAYIQNLETSRIRLSQMEQELQRSRTQEVILGGGALSGGNGGLSPEAAWFDAEHARWLEEHGMLTGHLRAALEEHAAAPAVADAQLRHLVDAAAAHHGVLAELKAAVARADAFHLVSGAWVSAAERCFLWIGGFRPSHIIKLVVRHAEPLTEQQAVGVCGVQRWAREAEAALDHELQAMHRSVSEAISSDAAALLCPYLDVPGYMATMSLAISKLASLEAFVRHADALRLQTLHRLTQILTARQSARCLLAIADYSYRLRALSELWLARPRQEPATTPAAGSSHRPSYLGRDTVVETTTKQGGDSFN
ncbi:transcription factor TGAL9-like isoform X2 [Phragmites australis]|uniref:transcription factor TGAL9-like isoform X2 n=1 Tax=Phragmites australis TaxID=29695 RepID=UPI002D78CE59|nr:transcription factor TGAL9-like isoform X2 [Phragmites australis]